MFDTTKDLRRVIKDAEQREKLVNNYRYRRQHNGGDKQWWIVLCCLLFIIVCCSFYFNGVCYG
jgi:uncharacterized membrane protein YkvA (DUF1232 family)